MLLWWAPPAGAAAALALSHGRYHLRGACCAHAPHAVVAFHLQVLLLSWR
jgi:hypothetical protein